jgi:hypothetical protein
MDFKTFMKKWEKKATSNDIPSNIWHLIIKEFWFYVRTAKEDILEDINVNHIPFSIRWALSEKFPELTKELLINARSFESLRGVNGGWHMVYGQDRLYIKQHLIPFLFKSHNTEHLSILKPLLLEHLDYQVS